MADIEVKFDAKELTRELQRLAKRAHNLRPINESIAEQMRLAVEDKFNDRGPGWPAIRDLTIRLRRRSKTPAPLQDSGNLAGSITPVADNDSAECYTNLGYAKFHVAKRHGGVNEGSINLKPLGHQKGTWRLPQRDFFDIDMEKILNYGVELLAEEIGRF